MNRKAEYQKWDEDAFQADLDVRYRLNWLQKLFYKQLLQSAWVYSTRPDLPNDDNQLWQLAGCPDLETWLKNKEPIVWFFDEEDGFLYQKRLREEWGFLSNIRGEASERGKAGAAARWSLAKPRNPLREIPVLAKQILGEMDTGDYWTKGIKDLTGIYGGTAVVDAFESWARGLTHPITKPVAAFCKVAVQYINLTPAEDSPDLDPLAKKLYEIGGQSFTGNKRSGLLTLLESYTSKEIEDAYKEFVAATDDYSIKFAPKNFLEGAAKDIIEAVKTRKQKAEETQRFIETVSAKEREAVEEKLREIESEGIEEHL